MNKYLICVTLLAAIGGISAAPRSDPQLSIADLTGLQTALADLINKAGASPNVQNLRSNVQQSQRRVPAGVRTNIAANIPGFAAQLQGVLPRVVVEETTVEDQPTKEIIEIIEEDIVPNRVIEEIIIEDRTVPEIIAQEIIIKDGTITHIGAGPYNGFIQSPHAIRVPAFIAAIREDGEIIAKSIIPIPVPHSADIPVPAEILAQLDPAAFGAGILDAGALPAGLLPIRAATVTPGLTIDTTAANLFARKEGGLLVQQPAAPVIVPAPVPVVARAPVPVVARAPVPVVAAAPVVARTPVVVAAAPAVVSNVNEQFHAQDESEGYNYGYSNGLSSKQEVRDSDGTVRGAYSYVDANGILQEVQYIADPVHGFKVVGTNIPA